MLLCISHCFFNTVTTPASLLCSCSLVFIWCLVVCIRLGHVEFLGDLMLNRLLKTWFKMGAVPLAQHSGAWQLGLGPAVWCSCSPWIPPETSVSWQLSDCWSAVSPGIPGLSESPVQLMSLVFSTWQTECSMRWLYTCLNTLHIFACIMFGIVFGPKQAAKALEIQG